MLCERCKHKDATVHLTEIIKGVRSEVHLCEHCARDIGLNSKLNNYALSVPDMLSYLDEGILDDHPGDVCTVCGISSADFESTGKVGCSHCYEALSPSINVLFPDGKESYAGKQPAAEGSSVPDAAPEPVEPASVLLGQLDEAVKEERYEDAAKIRDLMRGRV
jgi:protein arginine kinase activator